MTIFQLHEHQRHELLRVGCGGGEGEGEWEGEGLVIQEYVAPKDFF